MEELGNIDQPCEFGAENYTKFYFKVLIFHQVVVFFLNYTLDMSMEKTEKLQDLVEDIKDMQVNIVPVGIGENAKLSELKWMATKDGTALHFGEYESPETLGTAVIQGNLERFNISLRTTPPQNN